MALVDLNSDYSLDACALARDTILNMTVAAFLQSIGEVPTLGSRLPKVVPAACHAHSAQHS
jgi:hypothetical protein